VWPYKKAYKKVYKKKIDKRRKDLLEDALGSYPLVKSSMERK
jgi:hypothetical protein